MSSEWLDANFSEPQGNIFGFFGFFSGIVKKSALKWNIYIYSWAFRQTISSANLRRLTEMLDDSSCTRTPVLSWRLRMLSEVKTSEDCIHASKLTPVELKCAKTKVFTNKEHLSEAPLKQPAPTKRERFHFAGAWCCRKRRGMFFKYSSCILFPDLFLHPCICNTPDKLTKHPKGDSEGTLGSDWLFEFGTEGFFCKWGDEMRVDTRSWAVLWKVILHKLELSESFCVYCAYVIFLN